MCDAQSGLLRALGAAGAPAASLRMARSEAWASATFAGARHHLEYEHLDPAVADAFAAAIGEREFSLPGHIVADIAVSARTQDAAGVALTVEALTVEDG